MKLTPKFIMHIFFFALVSFEVSGFHIWLIVFFIEFDFYRVQIWNLEIIRKCCQSMSKQKQELSKVYALLLCWVPSNTLPKTQIFLCVMWSVYNLQPD